MTVRGAEPIEETEGARLGHIHHVAAGIPAVYQSTRFTIREMGLVRGLKTWLDVNKKGGFDCQSCAWPSPDEGRHIFEFCENGVKAVADEATKHRIAGDFFARYSIADLQEKSDLCSASRTAHAADGQTPRWHALRGDHLGRGE